MNFSQKLGLFLLIVISAVYIYFSFFNEKVKLIDFKSIKEEKATEFNPFEPQVKTEPKKSIKTEPQETKKSEKTVKIYLLDKNAKLRSVNRTCNPSTEKSCFEFAIKELVTAPSKWEKSNGFTSEIPYGTKVLSVRESSNSIMIDLSSNFESGGGTESTYCRIKQIIKTAKANTTLPVYLFINGKQANVIGGEGIMIKQPLSERSLDE